MSTRTGAVKAFWRFQQVDQLNAELIFGCTPGMQEVRAKLDCALRSDLPVLIEGESGTGKELVGRYLHWQSARRNGPYIKVNCGALRESEFKVFGCGIGVSNESQKAKTTVERPLGGTIFLDELGDLDEVIQQQLIWLFEADGCGRRYVSQDRMSPRFVCASSLNLGLKAPRDSTLAALLGCFEHRVRLLPLRERKSDLPQLCEFMAEKFARSFNRPVPRLSPVVLELFAEWNWPGNIRELENWIARIVVLGTEEAMAAGRHRQREGRTDFGPRRHRATRANVSIARRTRKYW
jgi:two-component system, NtrC family, response regulator AtoC